MLSPEEIMKWAEKIFSGASDSRLPSNVSGLSLAKRRQWVGAWNGRFKSCQSDGGSSKDCESSAFAVANAAIKDLSDEDAEKTVWIEGWDVMDAQVSQPEANYNPIGGSDERACGNCQWFISPNGCVVVKSVPDPINPNGVSDLWRARVPFQQEPMPVVIIEEQNAATTIEVPKGLIEKAKEAVMKVINLGRQDAIVPAKPLTIFKDKDGDLRWFAWASNRWRDRDYPPEILEDKAHKDFVDYIDGGGAMPEAWLWHTPGTRWGQADWVEYADGFLMVSGTVDKGKEHVAESIMNDPDVGVSHGFRYRHSDPGEGIIGWYRTFEVSSLPIGSAANQWTDMAVIKKEIDMGFSQAKREYLVSKVGEDVTQTIEADTSKMQAVLDALGVDTKDMPEEKDGKDGVEPQVKVTNNAAPSEEQMKALVQDAAKAAATAVVETEAFKGILQSVTDLTEANKGILDRLIELEKTDDQKIAEVITGVRKNRGHVASQSGDSVIDKDDPNYKEAVKEPTILDTIVEELETPAPVR